MKKVFESCKPQFSARSRRAIRHLRLRRSPNSSTSGLLLCGTRTIRCSLGFSGIGILKREGDGKTPLGRFSLLDTHLRYDKNLTRLGKRISPTDGWCDSTDDRNYNCPVSLPYPTSCESLWRQDSLYDIMIVLDYNIRSRLRRGGSAVFFHLATSDYSPTQGCVAIARPDMDYLLPRLSPDCVLEIIG